MTEFFANNLRFRKNEEKTPLQTCWCAATIKTFFSITIKEIDSVDVIAVCDEIKNKFSETQGKTRCSLYLASQLMFGAVRVFQAQTDLCLKACQNLCESFMQRAETKKKATNEKKNNKFGETKSSPVDASPKIPEIPKVDIFSLLEKDSAKDVNLIEEIDFPPDHTNDLSFAFSNDAECDDAAMEEEFDRELQRILREENDVPPRPSTNSPPHEEAPSIDNVQSPKIPDNENDTMDQDQMSLNENRIHNDMRRKLQKTPTRKARPILSDVNESTPPSVRAVISPLASKAPSLPQSPLFMSPVFGKRKRPRVLGRDVTIMEPITEAALPTDSPLQSRLPIECATPPRLFSTTLGAFDSPSGNGELSNRRSNIQPEKEKEFTLEHDEAIESTPGNKNAPLPAGGEGSVKSLSQSTARSQKVTTKPMDNSANKRRSKKRIFQDSETTLDDRDFAKRLRNTNYLIKKKEKALISSISSAAQSSAARFLLTLPCVLQKQSISISNRFMQLYKQDIQLLEISAKQPPASQHSPQPSPQHEEEIPQQSPATIVIEENVEPQQINQHFEDDDIMMPEDNVLNKQRLQVPTEVQTDYVTNEDEVQDNNSPVATSCIPAQVNSSQSTVAVSVGTVSPSASFNKENEQVFYRPASPCTSIQSNRRQLFEPSQTAHIDEVSEEVDDRQQENDQVLHQAKRFKAGGTEFELDLTVQNSKTIFLSLEDFYARVESFWNESNKSNRRINGKVIAVFQEVVSPGNSSLYEVLKYLIYCFMLERERKMDLHQQKPWNPVYILQRL